MTVGQLEQLLKHYPREASVLIYDAANHEGRRIKADPIVTYIRPDIESVPSSIVLVPDLTPKGGQIVTGNIDLLKF